MTIAIQDDAPRRAGAAGFTDAITFSFGDADARLFGMARITLAAGAATGVAAMFSADKPIAEIVQGPVAMSPPATWDEVAVAGLSTTTIAPLQTWTIALEGRDAGFELRFDALCLPLELAATDAAAEASGLEGYEQLCRVTGNVRARGHKNQVRCLGQRGHQWGTTDWKRVELARTLTAWMTDTSALTLTAVRPQRGRHHVDESISTWLIADGEPQTVAETLLSTAYDARGQHRRAGLELWMDPESGRAHRVAGEVLCATTLALGQLCLDSAFFGWRMDGLTGVGRYDVLRRSHS